MTPISIAVLSLSMSADAFAASVGRGAAHRPNFSTAVRNGLVFGLIEAITPLIGWALGLAAAGFVERVDHWIAFGLLAVVGGKMIWEASKPRDADEDAGPRRAGPWALIATAVGTSIDAAAVGVGLAFIGANIWIIAAAIGFTTFLCTAAGFFLTRRLHRFPTFHLEAGAGLILIGLGVKMLCDHLC